MISLIVVIYFRIKINLKQCNLIGFTLKEISHIRM